MCVQDFLRPIVTPFELELALTSKAWTGDYILDFAQLLESSDFGQDAGTVEVVRAEEDEGDADGADKEAPVFSAVTGTYRHPKKYYQRGFKGASQGVLHLSRLSSQQSADSAAPLVPRTDADDLTAQASALAIRDQSSAVARVLGSAAGQPSSLLLSALVKLTVFLDQASTCRHAHTRVSSRATGRTRRLYSRWAEKGGLREATAMRGGMTVNQSVEGACNAALVETTLACVTFESEEETKDEFLECLRQSSVRCSPSKQTSAFHPFSALVLRTAVGQRGCHEGCGSRRSFYVRWPSQLSLVELCCRLKTALSRETSERSARRRGTNHRHGNSRGPAAAARRIQQLEIG